MFFKSSVHYCGEKKASPWAAKFAVVVTGFFGLSFFKRKMLTSFMRPGLESQHGEATNAFVLLGWAPTSASWSWQVQRPSRGQSWGA